MHKDLQLKQQALGKLSLDALFRRICIAAAYSALTDTSASAGCGDDYVTMGETNSGRSNQWNKGDDFFARIHYQRHTNSVDTSSIHFAENFEHSQITKPEVSSN
jgi:hypothetical protein